MSRSWRVVVAVAAVVVIVLTPAVWLLDGPNAGQLVGASVQAATGVCALVWTWVQSSGRAETGVGDTAVRTGHAEASDGGRAHTGIRGPAGAGSSSARVQETGTARARGRGSSAGTGVDYTG